MSTVMAHPTDRTVMMLDRLREIYESDAALARAVAVDPAQLSRWRRGQEPSEPGWDRLVDLFAVVSKLEAIYPPARIRAWLDGPNAHLGDRSPVHLVRRGETGEVVAAIHATKAGAFA